MGFATSGSVSQNIASESVDGKYIDYSEDILEENDIFVNIFSKNSMHSPEGSSLPVSSSRLRSRGL